MENEIEKTEIIEPEIMEIPDDFGIPNRILPTDGSIELNGEPEKPKTFDDELALRSEQTQEAEQFELQQKLAHDEQTNDEPVPVEQAESEN
jgi:hypothetical protein